MANLPFPQGYLYPSSVKDKGDNQKQINDEEGKIGSWKQIILFVMKDYTVTPPYDSQFEHTKQSKDTD